MEEVAPQLVFEYKAVVEKGLQNVDRGKREMVGMFANYITPDLYGDVSHKGMFDRTWNETKSRVRHVFNHDMSRPVGKISELWDDAKGAYYRSKVGTHKFGDDVLEMAESGLLDEHSFGFKTIRGPKNKHGGRDLLEVKHFEVTSASEWAVHGNTPLLSVTKAGDLVSLAEKLEAKYKSLDKFCRNSNASDETIEEMQYKTEFLLLEIKQLHQHILDLSMTSTQAAVEAPAPRKGLSENEIAAAIIHLKSPGFVL